MNGDGSCSGITGCNDGSSIITGSFDDTAVFGEGDPNETTLTSYGNYDVYFAKYHSDGSLAWATQAGSDLDVKTVGSDIDSRMDCSSIVTGCFSTSAVFGRGEPNETVLTSEGNEDIFLAQYNPDGTLSWATSLGGATVDHGSGITYLTDGTFCLSGSYDGIYFSKFSSSGNPLWERRGHGNSEKYGTDVASLADGSCLMVGYFTEMIQFEGGEAGQDTLYTQAQDWTTDIFIVKYSPDGALLWAKSAGGPFNDEDFMMGDTGNAITTLPDGSFLVTGIFYGEATFGKGEPNETTVLSSGDITDQAFYVAKYHQDGTLAWVKTSIGANIGNDIVAAPDGSFLVTGLFGDSATFGKGEANETVLTSEGGIDIFIAKYVQ